MSLKIPPTQQSTGEEYDVQDFHPQKVNSGQNQHNFSLKFWLSNYSKHYDYKRLSKIQEIGLEKSIIERKVDFYDNIIRFCGVTRGLIMKLQAYDFDIIHRSGKKHLKNITIWTLFSNLGMINLILHFNWRMPIIIAMICISRIH
ncbi:hypothetical protein RIR_jg3983.t1 [Rhizophagus irregularis DAOM 181602=DAOM 197198]|nr:hypothetical protein RIR_jg3983.t1 [Rhizophagus irregularis DAOM 181602=DAOM 197198]